MKTIALLAALLSACAVTEAEPEPLTCAEAGCPFAPSGDPDIWTPCEGEMCWCDKPAVACIQATGS